MWLSPETCFRCDSGTCSQNKSCGCWSVQQCFMAKIRVWCTECGESSFGQMGGGCASSTVIRDVGTWWVHDAGWSWQRLVGCTRMRVNVHGCVQWHVRRKVLARNAWGWLRGCWGVQWLCRWVWDVTRSPGKLCGSGGVGTGYDRGPLLCMSCLSSKRVVFVQVSKCGCSL